MDMVHHIRETLAQKCAKPHRLLAQQPGAFREKRREATQIDELRRDADAVESHGHPDATARDHSPHLASHAAKHHAHDIDERARALLLLLGFCRLRGRLIRLLFVSRRFASDGLAVFRVVLERNRSADALELRAVILYL